MLPAIIRQASASILAQKQPIYHRFLHKEIDFYEPLIGIKGARGSGKTTIMLQYVLDSGIPKEKILYAACDHPAMAEIDLYQMIQTFSRKAANCCSSMKSIRIRVLGRL